jgi:hypothetical protein
MLTTNYNYQETLAASAKANWRIEDIIGGDKTTRFQQTLHARVAGSTARID